MSINLNECDQVCFGCIKHYIKKHHITKKDKSGEIFRIPCHGIPLEYISDSLVSAVGGDKEIAQSVLDPVTWANVNLDWWCEDPIGEVWKRKTEEGTIPPSLPKYDPIKAAKGESIFHRPYQKTMLQCTSQRKVFRCGRQLGKTEILCIVILHAIFTHENFKVVVITPFQSQIDLIFTRLSTLMSSNVMLTNSIKRNVKAPNYQIVLHNKSQVSGFTAGTHSGQNAGASRGQSGNMLVFDEADMLSSGDIDAALAIITNFPEATVWMSSTPTGKRERFFSACNSRLFREFHYPSHVNPNWTQQLDDLYKEQLTEDGYKHEILGEFGEQEEGVYQYKYVEAAQADYTYPQMIPKQNWVYMIGVDWNDPKIGTTIAVVGYSVDGKFYLCDKHIISRGERTQLSACEKIVELNRVWNPDAIYVDRGYGTTQIEVLQEFGHKSIKDFGPTHPNSKLLHRIKPFDFGSTVESHDLITGQPIKKPAKPFLVENSVRRFESYSFCYPKSDEHYTAQLLGYVIDRVTDSGRFVYKQQNESVGDHFLDAVNLALLGFTLEKTKFGKPKYDSSIAFANQLKPIVELLPSTETMASYSQKHKPESGRASSVVEKNHLQIPAAHSVHETTTAIWAWPGFGHDAPRPVMKKPNLFTSTGRRLSRDSGRPRRNKF